MLYYKILRFFYQDSKNENLLFKSVLSSRSKNTGPITRGHVKSSQIMSETPLKLKRLFLHVRTGIIFLLFRSRIHQCFLTPLFHLALENFSSHLF